MAAFDQMFDCQGRAIDCIDIYEWEIAFRQLAHQHDRQSLPVQANKLGFFQARTGENDPVHVVLLHQVHIAVTIFRFQRFQQYLEALGCGRLFNAQQHLGE